MLLSWRELAVLVGDGLASHFEWAKTSAMSRRKSGPEMGVPFPCIDQLRLSLTRFSQVDTASAQVANSERCPFTQVALCARFVLRTDVRLITFKSRSCGFRQNFVPAPPSVPKAFAFFAQIFERRRPMLFQETRPGACRCSSGSRVFRQTRLLLAPCLIGTAPASSPPLPVRTPVNTYPPAQVPS